MPKDQYPKIFLPEKSAIWIELVVVVGVDGEARLRTNSANPVGNNSLNRFEKLEATCL